MRPHCSRPSQSRHAFSLCSLGSLFLSFIPYLTARDWSQRWHRLWSPLGASAIERTEVRGVRCFLCVLTPHVTSAPWLQLRYSNIQIYVRSCRVLRSPLKFSSTPHTWGIVRDNSQSICVFAATPRTTLIICLFCSSLRKGSKFRAPKWTPSGSEGFYLGAYMVAVILAWCHLSERMFASTWEQCLGTTTDLSMEETCWICPWQVFNGTWCLPYSCARALIWHIWTYSCRMCCLLVQRRGLSLLVRVEENRKRQSGPLFTCALTFWM